MEQHDKKLSDDPSVTLTIRLIMQGKVSYFLLKCINKIVYCNMQWRNKGFKIIYRWMSIEINKLLN